LVSRYIGTKKLRESTRRETAPGPPGHLVYVHFLSEHAWDTARRIEKVEAASREGLAKTWTTSAQESAGL